jgi:hypothetical protein
MVRSDFSGMVVIVNLDCSDDRVDFEVIRMIVSWHFG